MIVCKVDSNFQVLSLKGLEIEAEPVGCHVSEIFGSSRTLEIALAGALNGNSFAPFVMDVNGKSLSFQFSAVERERDSRGVVLLGLATGQKSILDRRILLDLVASSEDGENLLRDLMSQVPIFAQKYLTELSEALAKGELKKAENAAHSLKSATAYLGAVELGFWCARMEKDVAVLKPNEIQAVFSEIKDAFHRFVTELSMLEA